MGLKEIDKLHYTRSSIPRKLLVWLLRVDRSAYTRLLNIIMQFSPVMRVELTSLNSQDASSPCESAVSPRDEKMSFIKLVRKEIVPVDLPHHNGGKVRSFYKQSNLIAACSLTDQLLIM